jgi:hypothetical protein
LPEQSRVEVIDEALIANPRPLPIHQRIVRRPGAEYTPGGLYRERFTAGEPFPVSIDLTGLSG